MKSMLAPPIGPSVASRGFATLESHHLLLAGIALVALLQLHNVFVQGINWDEFFFYSHIYMLQAGTLHEPLQTIHTRLFYWLTFIPGGEIAQLRVARLVMLGCELVTTACVVGIARRFVSRETSLIAGLAYIGGGFVFVHGASFRADPIAAALMMSALWLLLWTRLTWRACLGTGLLLALAGLVTVKSIFYAPAFAGIALLRLGESDEPVRTFVRMTAIALLAAVIFALGYMLHKASLPQAVVANSQAMVSNAADKMFFSMGFVPRLNYVLKQIGLAPFLAIAILALPIVILLVRRPWTVKVALVGLLLPILVLLVYRNSFPYFYAFILPPVVAAAAITVSGPVARYGALLIAAIPLANAVALYTAMPKDMQKTQATVFAAVHQMFPRPVPYIDFCSMIGPFPQRGFFMSGWGMDVYREGGLTRFVEILAQKPVPLLVGNHVGLIAAVTGRETHDPLLPADAAILKDNFVHHWGPLWVAGKSIAPGSQPTDMNVAVEGWYTVEGAPVRIDGASHAIGDSLWLARGPHVIAGGRERAARLRWGRHLPVPSAPQPKPGVFGIFTDF